MMVTAKEREKHKEGGEWIFIEGCPGEASVKRCLLKRDLKEVKKKASHVDIRALGITGRGAASAKALRLQVPAVLKESRRPGWQGPQEQEGEG